MSGSGSATDKSVSLGRAHSLPGPYLLEQKKKKKGRGPYRWVLRSLLKKKNFSISNSTPQPNFLRVMFIPPVYISLPFICSWTHSNLACPQALVISLKQPSTVTKDFWVAKITFQFISLKLLQTMDSLSIFKTIPSWFSLPSLVTHWLL